jgi:uncharacterized protein DUF4338
MSDLDIVFSGRYLPAQDVELIRQVVADFPRLTLHELANTVSELLDWHRPNGKLKTRECVDLLQLLAAKGRLTGLPVLLTTSPRGARSVLVDRSSDPQAPVKGDLRDHLPLQLRLIDNRADRVLFQQYIQRYHYLGYRIPYGAQLRYFVYSSALSNPLLGCLLFTSAAWKMAPRDHWIGWSDTARRSNLCCLVNHGRFLILPWVRLPSLASHLLSRMTTQLRQDWWTHYQVEPLLLETLVDVSRFNGTCYRAANWIDLGLTQGRGRMDRHTQWQGHSPKRIFIYPLQGDARQLLSAPISHHQKGECH